MAARDGRHNPPIAPNYGLRKPRHARAPRGPLEHRARGVVGQHHGADVGEALVAVVLLELVVGRPHVDAEPTGALVGGAGAGPVEQLGAEVFTSVGTADRGLVA